MELDALLLSRIQFAFTIGYHILFPALSMGLAMFLLVLEVLERKTGDPRYLQAWHFWTKIFSLSFGMGVVSGVVLSYEISTNFGRFSEIAGPVVGPLMSYEVLSAFFLEAGFLGIMLLGRQRVGPRVHLFATSMVAFGTLMSAFWILSANSFMHTPAGFRMENGVLHVESWMKVIFNPSFPYRYLHMVTAAYLTTSFVVIGTGAWYLVHKQHQNFGRHMLKLGLTAAAVLAPLQIFLGDEHGLNTLEHQPIKVAAMEGHWRNEGPVPLLLFAIPDQAAEKNHFEIAVPNLGSLILTHKVDGAIRGLTEVPPEDRPRVAIVFWAFRVMVGCGLLMLGQAWLGLWLDRKNKLENYPLLLRVMVLSGPIGFVAVLAGWIVTECGRQPWVVYGLLRTRDASSLVPGAAVGFTLLVFVIVYSVLLVAFLVFLRHLIRKGPAAGEPASHDIGTPPLTVEEG